MRRRRRRRPLEAGRRLGHLVRRSLLLLRRRRRWDGPARTTTTLATHDGAEGVGSHADGWGRCLRRTSVGRRADHGTLRGASADAFELATKVGDLFFKPVWRIAVSDCRRATIAGCDWLIWVL